MYASIKPDVSLKNLKRQFSLKSHSRYVFTLCNSTTRLIFASKSKRNPIFHKILRLQKSSFVKLEFHIIYARLKSLIPFVITSLFLAAIYCFHKNGQELPTERRWSTNHPNNEISDPGDKVVGSTHLITEQRDILRFENFFNVFSVVFINFFESQGMIRTKIIGTVGREKKTSSASDTVSKPLWRAKFFLIYRHELNLFP